MSFGVGVASLSKAGEFDVRSTAKLAVFPGQLARFSRYHFQCNESDFQKPSALGICLSLRAEPELAVSQTSNPILCFGLLLALEFCAKNRLH